MIQPTGHAVLRALGLADALLDHGARIDRLHGEAGSSGRVVLDVSYAALGKGAGLGVGIHRATLFALLHDAVAAEGIAIETGCVVEASERLSDDRRRLLLEGGRSVGPFDLIVDALGTRTPLAPPCGRALAYGALWGTLDWPPDAGFDPAALEQRYRRASVMVGVLPIGRLYGSTRGRPRWCGTAPPASPSIRPSSGNRGRPRASATTCAREASRRRCARGPDW